MWSIIDEKIVCVFMNNIQKSREKSVDHVKSWTDDFRLCISFDYSFGAKSERGGGVHLIHSSLFSRNILWTYIDVVHVTCVVIRQALFSLCIFPRGQQLPTQTHGTLCQRGFLFNINATTTKDLCPSRFCASFIYGAKESTFYFFFTKKESAPSLIDSILEPQASYTPLPIPYITNTSYIWVALGAFTNN